MSEAVEMPESSLRYFLNVVFRHKWKVGLFAVTVVSAVTVWTFLQPGMFMSSAKLLVVPGPSQSRYVELFGGWQHAGHDLYAPGLWIYEVTSALCKAVRFGGLTAAEAERCLTQALNLDVRLVAADETQVRAAFAWTVRLHRAAAYDSGCTRQHYLALAESLGCELWTADRRLCNAVALPWVRTVEENQKPRF